MSDDSDREWMFGVLDEHEAPLLRFARSMVGASLADDVVQDTFLRLCKQNRRDVEGHVAAWLFRVCRNRAIELLRGQGRLRNLEESNVDASPDSGPVAKLERKESMTRIGAAIEALPDRQREALLLKLDAGLSYKQIAEVMDTSVGNVGWVLHHALKAVREAVTDDGALPRAAGRTS